MLYNPSPLQSTMALLTTDLVPVSQLTCVQASVAHGTALSPLLLSHSRNLQVKRIPGCS